MVPFYFENRLLDQRNVQVVHVARQLPAARHDPEVVIGTYQSIGARHGSRMHLIAACDSHEVLDAEMESETLDCGQQQGRRRNVMTQVGCVSNERETVTLALHATNEDGVFTR